jgi:hypothetical protein
VKFLEPGVYRRITLLHRYTVDRVDLSEPLFEHRLTDFLVESYPEDVARYFEVVATGANEIAIVYVNDRVSAVLGPADRKLFAKGVHRIRAERFEIVDNLDVDVRLAKRLVAGKDARLKAVAGEFVHARVVPEGHVGLLYVDGELARTLLPGDMKELLAKVVEAEKAAQANVIRRREETNATRSLLNTAKVMESNAVALRLKELETLEKITEKIGNISVYGGLDSVLDGLVRMNR